MADISVNYKNNEIANTSYSGTLILETAGTWLEDDIEVVYDRPSGGGGGMTVVETPDSHGGTIVTITGEEITLQSKSVIPTTLSQIVSADSGYTGLAYVDVAGDANLLASNIASGVTIFGVTGTLSGGGGTGWETAPESWVEDLNNNTLSEVYGSMVTYLRSYAFYYQSALTTIDFPNCISTGLNAFRHCSNLVNVSLPNCASIGSYTFADCSNLVSISLPRCASIDYGVFQGCFKLTDVNLPNCVSINYYGFSRCSSLTIASFPKCVTIQGQAFVSCINLITASFPNCTWIGQQAFSSCVNLVNTYFPNCSLISTQAFTYCTNLTTLSLPHCQSIWSSVFSNCTKLESLYLLGRYVPTLNNSNAFTNTPMTNSTYLGYYGSIYVQSCLLNNFKTSPNWSFFVDRFVGI